MYILTYFEYLVVDSAQNPSALHFVSHLPKMLQPDNKWQVNIENMQ